MKFILKDNIKVRKEGFGCIILIGERKSVRFYNEFGYQIFFLLKQPLSVEEIISKTEVKYDISNVSPDEIRDFVSGLVDSKICDVATAERNSEAKFFFTNINEFSEAYFYSPLGVEIEYTNKCARQCDYCSYYSNPFVDETKEMKLEEWIKVLENIVSSGVYYVRFTGGDPFMRKDILSAVKYANDLGLMVSIGSDLTVTTEEDYKALSKLENFVYLQTTLDGATEESCERFRGKGNFKKVLKGMELLSKYKVPFIVGTVLTRHNVDEIELIGKIVGKFSSNGYCFSPLYLAGRGIGMEDDMPSNEDLYRANLQFKKLIEERVVKSADSAWNEITRDLDDNQFKTLLDNQSYLTRNGERLIRIDPKGNCYVSVKLKRALVENEEEWSAGNIKNNDLLNIWQDSDDIKKWRSFDIKYNSFGNTIDTRNLIISE